MSLKQQALDAYNEGSPILTDAEWDAMFANDGSDELGKKGKVRLPYRMGSLKKYFVGEDNLPSDLHLYLKTPKFDGCAVGLFYQHGELKFAATRGDGEWGQDITEKVKLIPNVPKTISSLQKKWVTGEVVLPLSVENGRNVVAGFLNRKYELNSFDSSKLRFFAYDAITSEEQYDDYIDTLCFGCADFNSVTAAADDMYPTDGVVYRILNNSAYHSSGFTGNYKNGAFAVKERSEGVITVLEDVIWQTGKSGKVTPVAILSPVNIGGAMVSRATLHNFSFIESLGLYKGAKVRVERSGEIIPRVIGLVDE